MSDRPVREIIFEATEALSELYRHWVARGVVEGADQEADTALRWFIDVTRELEEVTTKKNLCINGENANGTSKGKGET